MSRRSLKGPVFIAIVSLLVLAPALLRTPGTPLSLAAGSALPSPTVSRSPTPSPAPTPSPTTLPKPTASPGPLPTPSPTPIPDSIWIRQILDRNGVNVWAIASDGSDHIYAAGQTRGVYPGQTREYWNAFVAKYNASGEAAWLRQVELSWEAWGVAADASGNVLVAGYTYGSLAGQNAGGGDAFLRKYDAAGNVIWTKQWGSDKDDLARGVAVDGAGNVFVVGHTDGTLASQTPAGQKDAFVARFDSSGTLVWMKQFGSDQWDRAIGAAADRAGNVYVTGFTDGALPSQTSLGGRDNFIVKFSPAGEVLWTRQFGTDRFERPYGLATDAAGNSYVVGYTDGEFAGQSRIGHADAFIARFDSSGNLHWVRQFGTVFNDLAYGVTIDPSGNVFVAGETMGAMPGQTASGARDGFIVRYDSAGNATWLRQFSPGAGAFTFGVATDASGYAYAGGTAGSNPEPYGFIIKFSPPAPPVPGPTPTPTPASTSSPTPTPAPSPAAAPTPTPHPSPTPGPPAAPTVTPAPTPTPMPSRTPAPGASVELGTVTVRAGLSSNAAVQVWARNINDVWGLGAYDLKVQFDPAKIRINGVSAGPPPFDSVTSGFLAGLTGANTTGRLPFNSFHTWSPGPTGDVHLATINVSALVPGTHTLALTITTLANVAAKPIPAFAVNGSVSAAQTLTVSKSVRAILDSDGVVVLSVAIGDATDLATGQKIKLDKGVKEFKGEITFPPGSATVLGAREGSAGFAVPEVTATGGRTTSVDASGAGQAASGTRIARLVPRLTAARDARVEISLRLPSITAGDGVTRLEDEGATTLTFRRGAVRGAETSSIVDALFIAQYLAGIRDISQIDPLNAASIYHDGPNGDRITILDALALAQQLAGLRDANFAFVK